MVPGTPDDSARLLWGHTTPAPAPLSIRCRRGDAGDGPRWSARAGTRSIGTTWWPASTPLAADDWLLLGVGVLWPVGVMEIAKMWSRTSLAPASLDFPGAR